MMKQLWIVSVFLGLATVVAAQEKPNVLIIYADDLGYGELSAYGADRVPTPHSDRLASEGLRFTDAYAAAAVCTPARYALLTGRYPWRTWLKQGVVGNTPSMFEWGEFTLPKLFKSAGYTTAAIGKWHIGFGERGAKDLNWNEDLPKGPVDCVGFDYFFGNSVSHFFPPYVYIENQRVVNLDPADPLSLVWPKGKPPQQKGGEAATYEQEDAGPEFARRVCDYLRENKDQPFFLIYNAIEPHTPFTAHPDFQGKSELGSYGDFMLQFDHGVGRILDTLDELGLTENTLVILTSDNGGISTRNGHLVRALADAGVDEYLPNAPLRGDKGDFLEGGFRIPFLIRWPGVVAPGSESDAIIVQTDLMASFANLLEVDIPTGAAEDSRDVLAALKGGAAPDTPVVLQSRAGHLALRQGDWIYLDGNNSGDYDTLDGVSVDTPGQLYNLKEDLHEDDNLYRQYPERVAAMQQTLAEIRDRVPPAAIGDGRTVFLNESIPARTHLGWNDDVWGGEREKPKRNNHYVRPSSAAETWIHGLGSYGDFIGESLTLSDGGTLFVSGGGEVNLIIDNGQLQNRFAGEAVMSGTIEIKNRARLLTVSGNLDLQAALSGDGILELSATTARAAGAQVTLNGEGAKYSGQFRIFKDSPQAPGYAVVFEKDYPRAGLVVDPASEPVFHLKGERTFRAVRMGPVILKPGTYDADQLKAQGVKSAWFKDLGGTLTVR